MIFIITAAFATVSCFLVAFVAAFSFQGTVKTLVAKPCLKRIQQARPLISVVNKVASPSAPVTAPSVGIRFRLDNLGPQPDSTKRAKRKGRGISAGQGASYGFGMRGQKSRSGPGVRKGFEGGSAGDAAEPRNHVVEEEEQNPNSNSTFPLSRRRGLLLLHHADLLQRQHLFSWQAWLKQY